ncbi:MAG: hypothetical protein CMB73_07720 [Euryarchaeota archaeon]|nr:hypothetical protein [Euryarchaeota archaeon]
MYIAGGIPPKILPLLTEQDGELMDAFNRCNASMHNLMASFPLTIVNHPSVGLLGAKVSGPNGTNTTP